MADVQCPNSKCTAERKGFRLKLDSWRHKLIHCVGFESILEGIYGPLLLKDISIFDDCEPEELDNWSMDASCSFCSLQLDKLGDHVPVATSPLSSPSDEMPSQAPSFLESNQSAHRFLYTVFHKKDVPLSSCDPNVPLVAQELMKKMIHQFALEYASKSPLYTTKNGYTTALLRPGPSDPDAPLDLTVSKYQENHGKEPQPEGVLDLSKRTSAPSAPSSLPTNQNLSGLQLPTNSEESQCEAEDAGMLETLNGCKSALQAVLQMLCPVHRSLLQQILTVAFQEHRWAFACTHRQLTQAESHCCHRAGELQDGTPPPPPFNDSNSHSRAPTYSSSDCNGQTDSLATRLSLDCNAHSSAPLTFSDTQVPSVSGCCCVQSCRMAADPGSPVCVCLKSLQCLPCQSLAVGRINKVVCAFTSSSSSSSPSLCPTSKLCPTSSVCPASTVCCSSSHNPLPCACCSEHTCLVRDTAEGSREVSGGKDPQCSVVLVRETPRSPSPPPLSPIPSDINGKAEEKPPSLLHHRDEGEDVQDHYMESNGQQGVSADVEIIKYPECKIPEQSQAEQNQSGILLQDVVDRFSEKLETIKPQEKDLPLPSLSSQSLEKGLNLCSLSNQSLESQKEAHLNEIITTCLYQDKNNDYNLSDLFHSHDINANQSPKTRFRRLQEARAAMRKTPDQPSTRRHTLEIKRELARLDPNNCWRKRSLGRNGKSKDGSAVASPPINSSCETSPVKEEMEGIRKNNIAKLEKMTPDWESTRVREEEEVDKIPIGETDTLTEERRIERGTQDVVKSNISEVVEMKKEEGQGRGVSEEESIERLNKEAQWNRVTLDEGQKSGVGEEVKTVIVTEEVKMEMLTEDEGKGMANMEGGTSVDNQTPSTTLQLNTIAEIVVKDESETPSSDKAYGHYLPEIPRTHKQLLTLSHDNDSLTRASGQGKRGRPERKDVPMSIQGKSRRNTVQRSRRQIVPPQRFSSYVTEPRKMYFAACFSESIFSQKTLKDRPLTDNGSDASYSQTASNNIHKAREEPLHSMPQLERQENEMNASECLLGERPGSPPIVLVCQSVQVTVPSAEKSSPKHSLQKRTDVRKSVARPNGRLQSPPTKRLNSESKLGIKSPKDHSKQKGDLTSDNTTISAKSQDTQYISPIKLMFVSPVGEDGVRYILRSAVSGSDGQGEETFDPCESSSWAGTPEKTKSPLVEHIALLPKRSPTKSGEGSPSKQAVITDTYRSTGSLNGIGGERQEGPLPFHETTLKRRPGRPKKLGPQLEKREKRPIGRPPKQKCVDQASCGPGTDGASFVNPKRAPEPDMEDKPNKNLKITVVYGRSRRSKRLVLEDSGLLQTSMIESPKVVSTNAHLDKTNVFQDNIVKDAPLIVEDLNFVRPVKDRREAPHSSSNIKCQKFKGGVPMRKPGRPAKVKISGISVTVTTVSPRQCKIHINRDARESPQRIRKKLLPEFQPSKDPKTISVQTSNDGTQTENKEDSKDSRKERPLPVRHSVRVRKPSVYLLHSVATSRSYSHSTALLRRSRQLLLNKASSQRKQEEAQGGGETSGEKPHLYVQAGKWNERKQVCQDLSHVAGVSMDSIFPQSGTLKWWAVSTQEKTLNQELARRIRLVSETWISDTHTNQERTSLKTRVSVKASSTSTKRPEPISMVRMLFDCPPTKPRSCSMGQLCSWFMQTTETQSLAIVKKASTRNPYEVMHYPHVTNRGSVSPSPQAERLRKHVKKFATAVPKSPTEHRQAQERLWYRSRRIVKHQLFASTVAPGRLCQRARWWKRRGMGNYLSNLLRVKSKFLTRRERVNRPKRQTNHMRLIKRGIPANKFPEQVKFSLKSSEKPFSSTATDHSFDDLENIWPASPAPLTEEMADIPKAQRLSSKAWSPETLKECKVFLKKINSPDTESTAEEDWDTCTVMLDDGSPSAYCPNGGRVEGGEREDNKAVKMQRKKRMKKRTKTKESDCSSLNETDQDGVGAGIRKGKQRSFEKVASESLLPSPAKLIRQSQGRGLTGLRWRDFVVGSSK
ncbi:uncharacterized protein lcorl isoform X2 [Hypomesus transpacificus]|uniref:uncharacterized protein lcorl isoform X2 n=1 Tax=Hypomesus transpacificus TaxID=137520 RepID=UPI001F07C827|nr:uncharacterized protein lcorl isoform X2 [Hypomesus transpacificus]